MAETVEDKLSALVARVGKVRRWLVTLAILKVAALCLIFVSGYVSVYAWLDHRLNFDEIGRIIAFALLITGVAFLLYRLTKSLLGHISYSGAANYIESKKNFHQQLVTAIEYYEKKHDYPYSRALAGYLVVQIDKRCKGFKFDSIVEKWRGFVFAAVILFGLSASCFYIRDNYIYFSSYFARLTHPLAAVDPLTATSLESLTKDMVVERGAEVTFAANIKGRVPEVGKLVLVDANSEPRDKSYGLKAEEMQLQPNFDAEEEPKFEAAKSFTQTGQFKYRFETGSVFSDWYKVTVCEAPQIKSIMAEVSLPRRWPRNTWFKPYTEQIEGHTLELIPWSKVTLNVQSTDNLKEAVMTGLDGRAVTEQLNGANQFTFSFTADKRGSIKFHLVGEKGLSNDNLPDLQVIVKTDEPPKFRLLSPQGDYLTTDVASVPITFEVTDDFGLDSIKMFLEMPSQPPKELTIPVEKGAKSKKFTHTLELEEYNLAVGDGILFYAKATDVDTGSALAQRTSGSDVYFIEIRPYRQYWRPKPGGGGGGGGGAAVAKLLDILEYTRAILKKTWVISNKPDLTEQDRSRLESIDGDVQYCAGQLERIRDDSQYGFNERDKAVLNEILEYYKQASGYLAEHNAASAIVPIKNAYRVLRKFVNELEMELKPPPSSSSGRQPRKPDSVKLQYMPQFGQYEKERIEDELKKLQQKLEKVAQKQKHLKKTFENFLKQQAEKKGPAQKMMDGQSPTTGDEKPVEGKGVSKSQSKGQSASKSQSGSKDQTGSKGQSASKSQSGSKDQTGSKGQSASKGQSGSKGQTGSKGQNGAQGQSAGKGQSGTKGESASDGGSAKTGQSATQPQSGAKGQSGTKGRSTAKSQGAGKPGIASASAEKRLKMLQAKQKALQEQVSQLKQDLKQVPEISEGGKTKGREEAQKHLERAIARMNDFDAGMSKARYEARMDEGKSSDAVETLESAKHELDMAGKALDGELTLNDKQSTAKRAREIAEKLDEDAQALDESVTPIEREQMLARLEAAKRLLESMTQPQWAMVSKGGGSLAAGHVYTENPNISPARVARTMARHFWSISINAKKRRGQLIEDEPSDVKFYELETKFFENAAKFNQKPVPK